MKTRPAPWCTSLILLALLCLTACASEIKQEADPVPERESAEDLAADYREALKKWTENRPEHYSLAFHYGAFSPYAGHWVIEVKGGKAIRRVLNGTPVPEDRTMMENICMERLFALAAPATNAVHYGPMRIFARFSKHGWVASVRRTKNPKSDIPMPKDLTWFYEVKSLTIH